MIYTRQVENISVQLEQGRLIQSEMPPGDMADLLLPVGVTASSHDS